MGLLDATLGITLLGITGAWTASVIEDHAARIASDARIERVADYTRRLRGGIAARDLHEIAEHGHDPSLARDQWSAPQPLEALQNEDAGSLRGDGDSDEAWLKNRLDDARLEAGLESGLGTRRLLHSAGEFEVARGTGARNALSLWSVHHNDGGETNMYLVGRSRPNFNADDSGPTDIPRVRLPSGPAAASNFALMMNDGSVVGPAARVVEGANAGGELREHGRFALPGDVFAVELVRSRAFECGPYIPSRADGDPICPSLGMFGLGIAQVVNDILRPIDMKNGTLRVEADEEGNGDFFQRVMQGTSGVQPQLTRARSGAFSADTIHLCAATATLEACGPLAEPGDVDSDEAASNNLELPIQGWVTIEATHVSVGGRLEAENVRSAANLAIDAGSIEIADLDANGDIAISDALVSGSVNVRNPLAGAARPRICQGCD